MAWQPNYVTDDEAKEYRRLEDTVDDVLIAVAITAASRAVDDHCRRQFGRVDAPEQRSYEIRWDRRVRRYVVDIDDLMTTVGLAVVVDGQEFTSDQWRLEPVNAAQKGKPWTQLVFARGVNPVRCNKFGDEEVYADPTASWGWTTYPTQVKLATLMQMNRFLARRDSPYGVAGSPQDGSEIRLLAKLDPDVITVLGSSLVRW